MPDVTLPDGSDPTWNGTAQLPPAWQNGVAQLRALGSPLSNIGSLGQAGIRALATVPYVMATASGGGQDPSGGGQDPSGALARAATADFRGPLAGMTARDTMANTARAVYGPALGAWISSQLGPMDDPIRLMAQQAINGSPPQQPSAPLATSLAALLAHLSPDASIPAGR
jgi:hypothetical protein